MTQQSSTNNSASHSTIAVTGANGFVGSFVVRELLRQGYAVRAVVRESSNCATLEGLDCSLHYANLKQPDTLEQAFRGTDGVIHIAALFREAKHGDDEYHRVNVQGTVNVFEAAKAVGVARVIHCSTVGVHSHIPNPPAVETEAYRPGDIYQETKCLGEQKALEYYREGEVRGVVIRPAMIWGPGDTRTLKLFKGLASERFPLIGTGKTLLHWVLVSDLARSFRLAYEATDLNDEVFIISGERPVPIRECFEVIAASFGSRSPKIAIPALPVQLLGTLVETVCKPLGIEPPIYRRRVDFFTKTRAFSSEKAKELLGYTPEFAFEDEVAHIADWYIKEGWIEPVQSKTENKAAAA